MDQLSVHKCKEIKPLYRELDIEPILNVGYCPDFNPIEAVFSKLNAVHNRTRLNYLVNKTIYNADKSYEMPSIVSANNIAQIV